ncbi:MAG: cytochrome c oxidase subunit II [Bryobacteraceae bacterium]
MPHFLALQQTSTFPVFVPHSHYAASIASLSNGVLYTALAILALVIGLVSYSSHKFRAKPGSPTPKPVYGNVKLEIGYTSAFVAILAVISVFSIRAMEASDPPTTQTDNLQIVAHQWWWEVRYPATGVVTANEVHIPVHQPEQIGLMSADVIHDFWVPELGRKMDVIPGIENRTWLAADTPGTYYGTCAEYCGQEHAWMRIRVIAQSPDEFQKWEKAQLVIPAAPAAGAAQQGAQDFLQLSCASCHTIRGTSANERIGPDLTHVASRQTIAAGRLENTPANLAKWLLDPDLIKPGCKMPNLHLPRQQQDELVAYLETLQ